MRVDGRVAIITGGGNGIGAALAERLVCTGARVVLADLDGTAAEEVAQRLTQAVPRAAVGVGADASAAVEIARLVELAESRFGPVDLYFANAGIFGAAGLGDSEESWTRAIEVNVLAHVRAARILVPGWLARGGGYFVSTASAAGLLTQIGMAQYSMTKHAAVAFAEWLAVTYGDRGISVSCLCPMGVDTELLHGPGETADGPPALAIDAVVRAGEVLAPADVADAVIDAVDRERFLILPHPEVLDMFRSKAADYDRWLAGMQRYQSRLADAPPGAGRV